MKYHETGFNRNLINIIRRLDLWAENPWRKYSFFIIIFFSAFFLGSSIGMINGVLALMDPIGAFFTVVIIEILVRFRNINKEKQSISIPMIDSFRMGFVYGLFMEGLKLF
ncbi:MULTISPECIES: DUF565 domain-containing protein [unclassified Prochlorococcus]|uniref:DUF565 domain-containing protein n=1 Tax=unclassified Prochlorococcus TaxID=2627481 RepID=UPI0005688F15|nr:MULTISPECIES: DUF565 domain-containing protein [unclassified Prochlorococcus]